MEFLFETTVPAPRDAVFAFHTDPGNLDLLMGGWPGYRLLRHDGSIRPGSTTWVRQRVGLVLPVVIALRHHLYEPPHRFAESAVHGPFSRFDHTHEFEEAPGGGTVVRDRLDLVLSPLLGGAPGTRWFVAPMVRRMWAFRHRALHGVVARGGLAGARIRSSPAHEDGP
jgi:ligand-binding SRPBCC domain-containing protein